MEPLLRLFNDDKKTKEALLNYLTGFFEEKIIERAKKKESVESLADAIIELEKGFEQLSIDYGVKTKQPKPTNQSR